MSRRLMTSLDEFPYYVLRGREDDENGGEEQGGDGSTPPENDEESNEGNEGDEYAGKDPRIKELSDENAKKRNQIKSLGSENEQLKQRLKEIEDADKSEKDKAVEKATELETKVTEQSNVIRKLQVENAFFAANDITWHDSEMALAHLDLEDAIDDDGVVDKKALKKAITDLAKAKPFLVKKDEQEEEEEQPPPSGSRVGSPGQGTGKEKDRDALMKKYPALRK